MTVNCAYDECRKEFVKSTHNQKYCSDICCRTATNLKVREKYYENRERLKGKRRYCSISGCDSILSRYNPEKICQECVAKEGSRERDGLLEMLRSVSG